MTVWMYHVYERSTHCVWGWGMVEGKVHEYFGRWNHEDSPPGLEIKWRLLDNDREVRGMERTLEICLHQKSMDQMEKLIPDFENRLMATLIYKKMETSNELAEPA